MTVAPRISAISDEGAIIITLEWRGSGPHEGEGCAIIFSVGDNEADFCVSNSERGYAEGGIAFKMSEGLPEHAEMLLWQIITDTGN